MQKSLWRYLAVGAILVAFLAVNAGSVDAKSDKSNKSQKQTKLKKIEGSRLRNTLKLNHALKTNLGLHLKVKGNRRTIPGKITRLFQAEVPTGAVETITFQGFEMKKGNKTYKIFIDSNTTLVNRLGAVITADQLVIGHKVSIRGQFLVGSSLQFMAKKVRDITLPIETTETETD